MARVKGITQAKNEARRIAVDLGYSNDILRRIEAATTHEEIRCAMATGRENIEYPGGTVGDAGGGVKSKPRWVWRFRSGKIYSK